MAVTLDGTQYKTAREGFRPKYERVGTTRLTLAGKTDRTEGKGSPREWLYTLRVTATQLSTLITSYNKNTAATNQLSFTDEDGTSHTVYFTDMGEPRNLGPIVTGGAAYFLVDVRLEKVLA